MLLASAEFYVECNLLVSIIDYLQVITPFHFRHCAMCFPIHTLPYFDHRTACSPIIFSTADLAQHFNVLTYGRSYASFFHLPYPKSQLPPHYNTSALLLSLRHLCNLSAFSVFPDSLTHKHIYLQEGPQALGILGYSNRSFLLLLVGNAFHIREVLMLLPPHLFISRKVFIY